MVLSPKTLAIAGTLLLLAGLERGFPLGRERAIPTQLGLNLGLGVGNMVLANLTTASLLDWSRQQPFPLGILANIPGEIPRFVLAFLSLDLLMYGWHWLMHHTAWGWRVHRLHHSDRYLSTLTTYRFHPLEVLPSNLPKIAVIWLLGITPTQWLLYESLYAMELLFHHSNWALPSRCDRYLSWLIVTPRYHRLHHSVEISNQRSNYASFLTVWDTLFGTRRYCSYIQNLALGAKSR